MWTAHEDCASTRHWHHLVSWSLSWWSWDLRVPTLFFSHLFLSYCMLILLWLLCRACMCTCCQSRLRGHLYVPWCPVHIPIPFTPMQTAALVTDASWTTSQ